MGGFFPGAPDLTLPSCKQGCYSGRPPSSAPDKHPCFVSFLHLYFAFWFLIRVRSALGRAAPGRQESWALGHLCHPATPQRHHSAQQTSRTQDLLKGIRRPRAFRMPSPVSNHCDRFCKDTSLRPRKRGHPPAHRARVVAGEGGAWGADRTRRAWRTKPRSPGFPQTFRSSSRGSTCSSGACHPFCRCFRFLLLHFPDFWCPSSPFRSTIAKKGPRPSPLLARRQAASHREAPSWPSRPATKVPGVPSGSPKRPQEGDSFLCQGGHRESLGTRPCAPSKCSEKR